MSTANPRAAAAGRATRARSRGPEALACGLDQPASPTTAGRSCGIGSASPVDLDAVAQVLRRARPAASRGSVAPIPRGTRRRRAGRGLRRHGRLSPAIWTSLSDLDRYALTRWRGGPTPNASPTPTPRSSGTPRSRRTCARRAACRWSTSAPRPSPSGAPRRRAGCSMNRDAFALLVEQRRAQRGRARHRARRRDHGRQAHRPS